MYVVSIDFNVIENSTYTCQSLFWTDTTKRDANAESIYDRPLY